MSKISLSHISAVVEAAVAFHTGRLSRIEAAEIAVRAGMNNASAARYVESMAAILRGSQYKSTISSVALEYFLNYIENNFDANQLNKSILAVSKHLDYYASLSNGGPMKASRVVLSKYRKVI